MKRRAILGLAALAGLGAGLPWLIPWRREARLAGACRAALTASFPPGVVAAPATEAFIARYTELALQSGLERAEESAVQHFLTSTNVVLHVETGEALEFDDVFYPPRTACANRLGALYAPDGEHEG